MSQQLNIDGWMKLAEHQRRISGTEMGVGEYRAPPPAPKDAQYRSVRMINGHLLTDTPTRLAKRRRASRRSKKDLFNKKIELLAKSAKKLFR